MRFSRCAVLVVAAALVKAARVDEEPEVQEEDAAPEPEAVSDEAQAAQLELAVAEGQSPDESQGEAEEAEAAEVEAEGSEDEEAEAAEQQQALQTSEEEEEVPQQTHKTQQQKHDQATQKRFQKVHKDIIQTVGGAEKQEAVAKAHSTVLHHAGKNLDLQVRAAKLQSIRAHRAKPAAKKHAEGAAERATTAAQLAGPIHVKACMATKEREAAEAKAVATHKKVRMLKQMYDQEEISRKTEHMLHEQSLNKAAEAAKEKEDTAEVQAEKDQIVQAKTKNAHATAEAAVQAIHKAKDAENKAFATKKKAVESQMNHRSIAAASAKEIEDRQADQADSEAALGAMGTIKEATMARSGAMDHMARKTANMAKTMAMKAKATKEATDGVQSHKKAKAAQAKATKDAADGVEAKGAQDACKCQPTWEYLGVEHRGCSTVKNSDFDWCYVVDDSCPTAEDSEHKEELRKWRKCESEEEEAEAAEPQEEEAY